MLRMTERSFAICYSDRTWTINVHALVIKSEVDPESLGILIEAVDVILDLWTGKLVHSVIVIIIQKKKNTRMQNDITIAEYVRTFLQKRH